MPDRLANKVALITGGSSGLGLATAERFIVSGGYGPLREGELERASQWGSALADALARKAATGG